MEQQPVSSVEDLPSTEQSEIAGTIKAVASLLLATAAMLTAGGRGGLLAAVVVVSLLGAVLILALRHESPRSTRRQS